MCPVPTRLRVQQIVRQQLRQMGIEVNIVNFPLRVFFGEILPRRRFTMALFFRLWYPTDGCAGTFTSEAIPSEANGWRGANIFGYRDAEMDQACRGAAAELDPEARKRLLQTSARIFSRDLPVLPPLLPRKRLGAEGRAPELRPEDDRKRDLERAHLVLEMKRVIVSALITSLTAVMAGGAIARSAPTVRDQVVIGDGAQFEPQTLSPLFSDHDAVAVMFTPDTQYDDRWRLVPFGVESLPSLKDGTWKVQGQSMTLVWRLRPRKWHDGRPVTCADFVFTFNLLRNEQVAVSSFGMEQARKRIANVLCPQGPEGREVTVRWNRRFVEAGLGVVGGFALPRHIVQSHYQTNPSRLAQAPYGREPELTVGDGPYRLVEWRHGDFLAVESIGAHPIYGSPRVRRIVWKFIRFAPGAIARAMVAGEVDAAADLGLSHILALRDYKGGDIRLVALPTLRWEHIDFNLDNPLLQDVRVRRAIAHAVNRIEIWRTATQALPGQISVAHSYLPPRHPGHAADVRSYPYDPARARRLLLDAGFTPGADGIMRSATGERLSLELSTTEAVAVRDLAAPVIQEQLRRVGIEVSIVKFPSRVFFELMRTRKFKALGMYTWIFAPTSDCDELYTSDGIPAEANGWNGQNFPGYRSIEMDRLCREASQEMDSDRRAGLLKETTRIFARDLPALPLVFHVQVAAVRVGLENFRPSALSGATWNAHTWYWK